MTTDSYFIHWLEESYLLVEITVMLIYFVNENRNESTQVNIQEDNLTSADLLSYTTNGSGVDLG